VVKKHKCVTNKYTLAQCSELNTRHETNPQKSDAWRSPAT